ncbi:MAG TPA: LacI family transcriptional regulator [bacterium]|nr:LacI family transcriptional regulator [bacterium]
MNNGEKMNIRDIARLAGVTHTTVSKILNNKGSISEKTKKRVLSVIKRANYYPNEAARITSTGRSGEIAFVSSRYASPFISLVLEGAEDCSYAMGKYENKISTYSTRGTKELKRDVFMRIAAGRLADAVIALALRPEKNAMKLFGKNDINVILIEEKAAGAYAINVNNSAGAYDAVIHLAKRGRKKIALIRGVTGSEEVGRVPFDRERGYRKALAEAGIEFNPDLVEPVIAYSFEEGKKALDNLLKRDRKVDAVFCAAGDICAMGVMKRAWQLGIKIPSDLAVIGFDDIPAASLVSPSLTTVRQPVFEMGSMAFRMAVDAAENRALQPQNVIIDPKLVARESA